MRIPLWSTHYIIFQAQKMRKINAAKKTRPNTDLSSAESESTGPIGIKDFLATIGLELKWGEKGSFTCDHLVFIAGMVTLALVTWKLAAALIVGYPAVAATRKLIKLLTRSN